MRDRYTWVSMRHDLVDQLRDLEAASCAIQTSTKPARVVLLMRNNRSIRQFVATYTKGVQKQVLVDISQTCDLLIKDDSSHLTHYDDPTWCNLDAPMILVILHNSQAPPYHTSHLTGLLADVPGLTVHPAPEIRCHPPPDVQEPIPTQVAPPRYHPLLRPSQTWYKAAHWMGPRNTDECKTDEAAAAADDRSISDKIHRVLALLGILPPGLEAAMASYWDTHEVDKRALATISNLILNKTLVLFRQDEAFRKWRKKTTAWRS
jgi:hypothetical protein